MEKQEMSQRPRTVLIFSIFFAVNALFSLYKLFSLYQDWTGFYLFNIRTLIYNGAAVLLLPAAVGLMLKQRWALLLCRIYAVLLVCLMSAFVAFAVTQIGSGPAFSTYGIQLVFAAVIGGAVFMFTKMPGVQEYFSRD